MCKSVIFERSCIVDPDGAFSQDAIGLIAFLKRRGYRVAVTSSPDLKGVALPAMGGGEPIAGGEGVGSLEDLLDDPEARERLAPPSAVLLSTNPRFARTAQDLGLDVYLVTRPGCEPPPPGYDGPAPVELDEAVEAMDRRALQERAVIATVGGLIQNDAGDVLLVVTRKWRGAYGLPGGKIEYGETVEAAYAREIQEETGLTVTDNVLLAIQDSIESTEFWEPRHFVLINYFSRTHGRSVTTNDEISEAVWVSPAQTLRLPLNQPTRRLIEIAFDRGLLGGRSES